MIILWWSVLLVYEAKGFSENQVTTNMPQVITNIITQSCIMYILPLVGIDITLKINIIQLQWWLIGTDCIYRYCKFTPMKTLHWSWQCRSLSAKQIAVSMINKQQCTFHRWNQKCTSQVSIVVNLSRRNLPEVPPQNVHKKKKMTIKKIALHN